MLRRCGIAALLVLISCLVPIALLEIGLRIAGYDPLGDLDFTGGGLFLRESTHPDRIYELTPNAHGFGWDTEVKVNEYGFRDDDYSVAKPEGVFRIVVLGDSITFGNGLAVEDTFPEKLEANLPAEARVEVLNLGLGGYDTLQEVATLEHLGLQFDPDLVVLAYCMNDLGVESANLEYIKRVEKYLDSPLYRLRVAQFVGSRIDRWFAQEDAERANSEQRFEEANKDAIANIEPDAKLVRLISMMKKNGVGGRGLDHTLKWYTSRSRIGKLRYSLQKLRILRDLHGFRVLVMIIPYIEDRRIYQAAYKIVEVEALRQDFDVLTLDGEFRTTGFWRLRQMPTDVIHPNRLGHEIIAGKLQDYLMGSPDFARRLQSP